MSGAAGGMSIGSLFARLDLDHGAFVTGLGTATAAVTTFQKATGKTNLLLSNLALAFSAVGIGHVVSEMVMAGEEMTQLARKMDVLSKSMRENNGVAADGAETMGYLRETALRTGSSFENLAKSYVQLTPVAVSTGIAIRDVRDAIEGTIGAGQVMGATNDEMGRAFVAIRQVIGKNSLQMEELRGQLGEALPNSMLIMADGLSKLAAGSEELRKQLGLTGGSAEVTLAKLNKLITEGAIDGNLFIRAWREGTAEFTKFTALAGTTVSGQMNNLRTIAVTNIGALMRDSGLNLTLAAMLEEFNGWFDDATGVAAERAREIGAAIYAGTREFFTLIARKLDEAFTLNQAVISATLTGFRQIGLGFATLMDVVPGWMLELGLIGFLILGKSGLRATAVIAAAFAGTIGAIRQMMETATADPFADDASGRDLYEAMAGRRKAYRMLPGYSKDERDTLLAPGKEAGEREMLLRKERERLTVEQQAVDGMKRELRRLEDAKTSGWQAMNANTAKREALEAAIKAREGKLTLQRQGFAELEGVNTKALSLGLDVEGWQKKTLGALRKPIDEAMTAGDDPGRKTNVQGVNEAFDAFNTGLVRSQLAINGVTEANLHLTKKMQESPEWQKLSPAKRDEWLRALSGGSSTLEAGALVPTSSAKIMADFAVAARKLAGDAAAKPEESRALLTGDLSKTTVGKLLSGDMAAEIGTTAEKQVSAAYLATLKKLANLGSYELSSEMDGAYAYQKKHFEQLAGDLVKIDKDAAKDVAELRVRLDTDYANGKEKRAAADQRTAELAMMKSVRESQRSADMLARAKQAFVDFYAGDEEALAAGAMKEKAAIFKREMSPDDAIFLRQKPGADLLDPLIQQKAVEALTLDVEKKRGAALLEILAHQNDGYRAALATEDADKRRLQLAQLQFQAGQQTLDSVVAEELRLADAQLDVERKKLDTILASASLRQRMLDTELKRLSVERDNLTLQAQQMMTPAWRQGQFETDNARVDVQMAQLYYEYSLTMEQRLQLVRAEGMRAFESTFTSGITSILTGQEKIGEGFRKMFGNALKYALEFLVKVQVQQAMMWGMTQLGMGGLFGAGSMGTGINTLAPSSINDAGAMSVEALRATIHHAGGFAGVGPGRSVPAGLFAGAERFHGGGLLRGEVPIIAKQGEAVFTPEQMNNADRILQSALNSANTGSQINQTVNVTVEASGGSQEQNADLAEKIGRQVRDQMRGMMLDEMRQQMRPGGLLKDGGMA